MMEIKEVKEWLEKALKEADEHLGSEDGNRFIYMAGTLRGHIDFILGEIDKSLDRG